jgi:hypothetical protein
MLVLCGRLLGCGERVSMGGGGRERWSRYVQGKRKGKGRGNAGTYRVV